MVPVVVIPVLNRYDLLERCIDSLDFPVDKIIIIDNGGKIEQDCLVMPRHSRHGKTYIMDMPSNLGVGDIVESWHQDDTVCSGLDSYELGRLGLCQTNLNSSGSRVIRTRFI
jgi:hypothetical protein